MKKLLVKTPAKINLTLEVLEKREDGYHQIQSVMQAVNLYDNVTITCEDYDRKDCHIEISGNSTLIPYNRNNLAYVAAYVFLQKAKVTHKKISINIEKHIPVAAGMAGGSTNAAGVLCGLNGLLDNPLSPFALSILASKIGSDVNFCINGGTQLATQRGEVLKRLPSPSFNVTVASPDNLYISAKEAYEKYAELSKKFSQNMTMDLVEKLTEDSSPYLISDYLVNDLEEAILTDYPLIGYLKNMLLDRGCISSLMSGSGPCVFGISSEPLTLLKPNKDITLFSLESVKHGCILE